MSCAKNWALQPVEAASREGREAPPSMLSSVPSATITPVRLTATPLRAIALWPGAGRSVQPQTGRLAMADTARFTTRWEGRQ